MKPKLIKIKPAQSAEAVEYAESITGEGLNPTNEFLRHDTKI